MRTFRNKFDAFEFRTIYITDPSEARKAVKLLSKINTLMGIDIETAKHETYLKHPSSGLCPHLSNIRLIQIFDGVDRSYVFDMFHLDIQTLAPILTAGHFVSHYSTFEIKHFTFNGFPDMNIECSMLMSQAIETAEHSPYEPTLLPGEEDEDEDDTDKSGLAIYKRTGHSLDAVVQRIFQVRVSKAEQRSNWNIKELTESQITYAGLDAVLTYSVAMAMAPKIKSYKMQKSYKLLKDSQHAIALLELEGIPVDWEYHAKLCIEWQTKTDAALAVCKPFFGDTNMRSGKQMNEWLTIYLKGKPALLASWPKTKKGALAFGKSAIADKSDLPAIAALLEYKKYAKLLSTYGHSLLNKKHPITGRLHTSYTLGKTTTGRLSSRNPNIQNMPREKSFRKMFKAEDNYVLVVSDFSSIELRIQAELSGDTTMLKAFKNKQDLYVLFATQYFKQDITKLPKDKYAEKRMFGKVCMLALGYGMGAPKLGMYAANTYNLKRPMTEWYKAHETYHDTFKIYSAYCTKIRDVATKQGYITTFMGKRRKLEPTEIYTAGPNTVIQGTAAELMLKAMIICKDKIKDEPLMKMVCTVHDELILHVHKNVAKRANELLASAMNQAMVEMFPGGVNNNVAEANYGLTWAEAK